MFSVVWSMIAGYLPFLILAALAILFWPQTLLAARWLVLTPRGRIVLLASVVALLWWRDHHLQYAEGLAAGREAQKAATAAEDAARWKATAEGYIALSSRFATLSENLDGQVTAAADAAARRVAADVTAGRLQLRPIWKVGADVLAATDPGRAAQLALDREAAAGRIVGIGAAADARLALCVGLLQAERAANPAPVTPAP